ncbi:MAG: DNA repair protein RecO [Bacilli bacterium]
MEREISGIIVSELTYSESSKIIKIITEDGIISCIAKGARGLKSELRATSTKLTYAKFNIIYKKDKLSTLISMDVINIFKKIKKDIDKISYASFMVELATQVIMQNQDKEIINILISSIIKLDEGFDHVVITNILELKFLDYLGVMPVVDCCAICGSKSSISTLAALSGGYVCKNCITNEKIVNEKTIKLIRMFYYVDISKIDKLEISSNIKKEINEFLDNYYEKYTGLYLKSKTFLNNLNKIK